MQPFFYCPTLTLSTARLFVFALLVDKGADIIEVRENQFCFRYPE